MTSKRIIKTAKSFRYSLWRSCFFCLSSSQCFLLSGFYFQRGNQNVEYDNPALYPQVLLTFLGVQYPSENKAVTEHVLNNYSNHILISSLVTNGSRYARILVSSRSVSVQTALTTCSCFRWTPDINYRRGCLPISPACDLGSDRQQVLAQMRKGDTIRM